MAESDLTQVTKLTNYALNYFIGSERRTKLSITSHIQNLKQKHEKLSSEVEQAYKSPASDELYISQLKKEKLRLKEEISRLSR